MNQEPTPSPDGGASIEIQVREALTTDERAEAMALRQAVFVEEQGVPADLEADEHEEESVHLIAVLTEGGMGGGLPVHLPIVGTCRFRRTMGGYKLERFAVRADSRNRGVGTALLDACLHALEDAPLEVSETIFVHAQREAVPFYAHRGFVPTGLPFMEAGIEHQAMRLDDGPARPPRF